MLQNVVFDNLTPCPPLFNQFVYFECVSVENSVGHEAEATRLVHNLLVVSGTERALVRKEDAPGELVAVLTLVELKLNGLP